VAIVRRHEREHDPRIPDRSEEQHDVAGNRGFSAGSDRREDQSRANQKHRCNETDRQRPMRPAKKHDDYRRVHALTSAQLSPGLAIFAGTESGATQTVARLPTAPREVAARVRLSPIKATAVLIILVPSSGHGAHDGRFTVGRASHIRSRVLITRTSHRAARHRGRCSARRCPVVPI
jgi:hypothetical protein